MTLTKEEMTNLISERVIAIGQTLNLDHWNINFVYAEPDEESTSANGWVKTAETFVNWAYQQATIKFFYENFKDEEDLSEIDLIILHEMGHILVAEMNAEEDKVNHEERVCANLAKVFYKLFDVITI